MDTIPKYTLGFDIETKDTLVTAYILAVGGVLFNNYTLRPISTLNLLLDPNDPEQANRTTSERTMEWWDNAGAGPRYPSLRARELTWSGRMSFNQAMKDLDQYLARLPKDGDTVLPMKGPDFDYPICKHALRQAGIYRNHLRATPLDSHRTVERVIKGLRLPPITELERKRWWGGGETLEHTALYDAGLEGYDTARMYHGIHLIAEYGYDEACRRLEAVRDGEVDLNAPPESSVKKVGYGPFVHQVEAHIDLFSKLEKKSVWLTDAGLASYNADNGHVFKGDCKVVVTRAEDLYGLHHYKDRPAALYLTPSFLR